MATVTGTLTSATVLKYTVDGRTALVRTSAAYTVLEGETLIEVTDVLAGRTITLPAANTVAPGALYVVKDGSGQANGTNKITILPPVLTPDTDRLRWRKSIAASGENATMRLATAAALPTCTASGSGVGKTLTGSAVGALSIDGVAVAANDAVLVKDQANEVDNGIYTVTAAGHAATFTLGTDSISFASSTGTATQTATRATAAVLPNTPTYDNAAGTLTAGANSTLTVDGGVVNLGEVVIVKDQATGTQNGIYTLTTAGSGAAAWVLTRATAWDTNTELNNAIGTIWTVTAGTANASTKWALSSPAAVFVLTRKTTFDASNETLPGYLVTMSAGSTQTGQYWFLKGGIDDKVSVLIDTAYDQVTLFSNGVDWKMTDSDA